MFLCFFQQHVRVFVLKVQTALRETASFRLEREWRWTNRLSVSVPTETGPGKRTHTPHANSGSGQTKKCSSRWRSMRWRERGRESESACPGWMLSHDGLSIHGLEKHNLRCTECQRRPRPHPSRPQDIRLQALLY